MEAGLYFPVYRRCFRGGNTIFSLWRLIAMGYFNAKVGCGEHLDITGQFGLGSRNERGSKLLQFCEENNMMIANTYFQHPKRRLYTWRSPGDIYRNQIDFILINKRFRNAVKQARTYLAADVAQTIPTDDQNEHKTDKPMKKLINQQM